MASLTPLSKGLIGLVVLGGMASAVWNLYLKERIGTPAEQPPAAVSAPMPQESPATNGAPADATSPAPAPQAQTPPAAEPLVVKPGKALNLSAAENFEAGRKAVASGDFALARPHLEQSLQQGNAGAACLLGDMTLKGQGGIPANQDKAAELFQLAQSRNIICFTVGQ
jgi:TPR repeat protein